MPKDNARGDSALPKVPIKTSAPGPAPIPPSNPHSTSPLPHGTEPTWQETHNTLQAALDQGSAILDRTPDPRARVVLNQILDTISDEITRLNQEDMQNRTISLQAASAELGSGIASLQNLQRDINAIAAAFVNAAEVIAIVSSAITGIQSFLSAFPAA